jgi:hypothetical protein
MDISFSWFNYLTTSWLQYFNGNLRKGPYAGINDNPIDTTNYLYQPGVRSFFYFYITSIDTAGSASVTSDTLEVSTAGAPSSMLVWLELCQRTGVHRQCILL